jgi:14-3-3 protein epsilon
VENMRRVADITKDLNNEERNLLSIAYKNTVG